MTGGSGASSPVASQPTAETRTPYQPCTETCTTDCGRCKGRPLADLKRRTARRQAMHEFGLTGQEALR